jgi:hypothetical protein
MGESFESSTLNFLPSTALFFDCQGSQKIGANPTLFETKTETFVIRGYPYRTQPLLDWAKTEKKASESSFGSESAGDAAPP